MLKPLLRELERSRLMFVEEPVLSEHLDTLPDLAAQSRIPIAHGERLFSRWDFRQFLQSGHADVIQPDPSHASGITETRKIASMAECCDVVLALHCPLSPIALAACLQLDAVCHNATIQELSLGIHYNQTSDLLDYLKDSSVFQCNNGYLRIPGEPGLEIEINEEYVIERAKVGHRWRNPLWRHRDGSVAEW